MEQPLLNARQEYAEAHKRWQQEKLRLKSNIEKVKDAMDCREIELDFLSFLSKYDFDTSSEDESSTTYLLLPYSLTAGKANVFEYLQEKNNEITAEICKYSSYFETGSATARLHIDGRIEGYKGDDTVFDDVDYLEMTDEEIERNSECILEDAGDLSFFCSKKELHVREVKSRHNIDWGDWGDWDDTYATLRLEVKVSFIKLK